VNLSLVGTGALNSSAISGTQALGTALTIAYPAHVTVTNLTIEDGVATLPPCPPGQICGPDTVGGGILNGGTLTLVHSAVLHNVATLGGGIFNAGLLTLINSSVSDNNAAIGAGIFNHGNVLLINATVTGNVNGGGINSLLSPITIINSTISGNSPYDCIGC
jgi:hypothetical protein